MSKKAIKEAKQLFNIASARILEANALRFYITPFNPLLQQKDMVKIHDKSLLARECEAAFLNLEDYDYGIDRIHLSTCIVVDCMSFIRGEVNEVIHVSLYPTFKHPGIYLIAKMVSSYPKVMFFSTAISRKLSEGS